MTATNGVQFPLPQDEIDRLLAQFDGETQSGYPDGVASICEAFDDWITKTSAEGSTPEPDLDRYRAAIWYMRGTMANANGDVDASLNFFLGSIQRSARVGDVPRQILGLRSIARCYEYAGMQAESTRCIFAALDLAEDLGDDWITGLVLHGLGALYEAQGAYEQLFESSTRTMEIAERIDDQFLLARAYGALSISCGYLDRADEGLEWSDKALELCETNGFERAAAIFSLNRIFLYQVAGLIDDGVVFADRQLPVIASLPPQHAAVLYVDVAEVNITAGNYGRAAEMLAHADEVITDDRMKAHLLRYFIVAASLHEAQGDPVNALAMMRRHLEHDREIRGRTAQARLVTAERFFASELAAKTEELHHLRTVELVEKNHQLSDLVHQKDEILHVVAHDLRNPLAAVQLLGESLVIDLRDQLQGDTLDRLRSISDAAVEMRSTVDTLLASQAGKTPSNPTSVTAAVQLAVEDAHEKSIAQNVEIIPNIEEADLVVNSALLRRSLYDLLGNAIDASESGSAVTITVVATDVGGANISIGGEHPPLGENLCDQRSLYIARRLIERMRGSVSLESSPDGNTTMKINLRP